MSGVALISVLYSLFFIALGKTQSDDAHRELIPYSLNGGKDIQLPDTKNCRIDVYDGMDNQAMYWQIPTIQAFHSIVPGSIMDFYPSIGVQRDVGSRPEAKYYGLRGLTSCRWLFDPVQSGKNFAGDEGEDTPAMPGWTFYAVQNGFNIYENDYYIPMGFSYDSYITRAEYEQVDKESRHLLLLKTLVLENDDVQKYAGILPHNDDFQSSEFTQSAYFEDCMNRKSEACSSFERDNSGFTAKITADKERLVFFSVPWEGGWSAQVNGKPAEIAKVNVGFMAVKVPAGESVIRFDYATPGLKLGAAISAGGAVLYLVFYLVTRAYDKRKPRKRKTYRIKYEELPAEEVRPAPEAPETTQ